MLNGSKKRYRIGFIFPEDLSWFGYKNYLINLITALDIHPKGKKIILICCNDKLNIIKSLKLKNIKVISTNFLNKKGFLNFIKKIFSYFFDRHDPLFFFFYKKI